MPQEGRHYDTKGQSQKEGDQHGDPDRVVPEEVEQNAERPPSFSRWHVHAGSLPRRRGGREGESIGCRPAAMGIHQASCHRYLHSVPQSRMRSIAKRSDFESPGGIAAGIPRVETFAGTYPDGALKGLHRREVGGVLAGRVEWSRMQDRLPHRSEEPRFFSKGQLDRSSPFHHLSGDTDSPTRTTLWRNRSQPKKGDRHNFPASDRWWSWMSPKEI